MSGGRIDQERKSHDLPPVSTVDAHRACMFGEPGHGYCGRQSDKHTVAEWSEARCEDCHAAHRADEAVS